MKTFPVIQGTLSTVADYETYREPHCPLGIHNANDEITHVSVRPFCSQAFLRRGRILGSSQRRLGRHTNVISRIICVYRVLRYLRQTPDVLYLRLLVPPVETRAPPADGDGQRRHAFAAIHRHVVEVGGIEPPSRQPFSFESCRAGAPRTTIPCLLLVPSCA